MLRYMKRPRPRCRSLGELQVTVYAYRVVRSLYILSTYPLDHRMMIVELRCHSQSIFAVTSVSHYEHRETTCHVIGY